MIVIIVPVVIAGLLVLTISAVWAMVLFCIALVLCGVSVLMEMPDE